LCFYFVYLLVFPLRVFALAVFALSVLFDPVRRCALTCFDSSLGTELNGRLERDLPSCIRVMLLLSGFTRFFPSSRRAAVGRQRVCGFPRAVLALGLAAVFALSVAPLVAQEASDSSMQWGYSREKGPMRWAKLDPAYKACQSGHLQSPIDIRGARLNKTLQQIEFHYIAGTVSELNDGHTVRMKVGAGSYIVAGGVRYDLIEFHFHHPSEETVKGKLSDMDVHLVHESADGKSVIVAIRLTEGNPNAVLATLWEHLPTKTGATEKVPELVNPAGLLPVDRGYWTYTGSMTTPPCTEPVAWFVFEEEKQLSRVQLRTFAELFKFNARPLQDPHGRRIEASE